MAGDRGGRQTDGGDPLKCPGCPVRADVICGGFRGGLSRPIPQDRPDISLALKHGDYFQWLRLRPVNQRVIRVTYERPKTKGTVCQVTADVTSEGTSGKEFASLVILGDVPPDFKDVGL